VKKLFLLKQFAQTDSEAETFYQQAQQANAEYAAFAGNL
jgi:hypothetical protein